MKYILERLKEPSSWRGLVLIATAFGVSVNPELLPSIIAVGTGLAGVIGCVFKDKVAE
jgi:hypothetical protein